MSLWLLLYVPLFLLTCNFHFSFQNKYRSLDIKNWNHPSTRVTPFFDDVPDQCAISHYNRQHFEYLTDKLCLVSWCLTLSNFSDDKSLDLTSCFLILLWMMFLLIELNCSSPIFSENSVLLDCFHVFRTTAQIRYGKNIIFTKTVSRIIVPFFT